jgi:hypothetical protein
MIEKGQTTPDDLLLDRVERLKAERAYCLAALERGKAGRESFTPIAEDKLTAFAELMRSRLTEGEVQFRKTYLSTLIERVEVGDDVIRIFGQKTMLEQHVATGGGASPGVRGFVRRWRPVGDSNPCCPRERRASWATRRTGRPGRSETCTGTGRVDQASCYQRAHVKRRSPRVNGDWRALRSSPRNAGLDHRFVLLIR